MGNFYYWGPVLYKTKISQADVDRILKLKVMNSIKHKLAGVIENENSLSSPKFFNIVEKYLDAFNLGIWVWAIPEASSSFAFVKHSKNKKTIYSSYVKDYEEQNGTWVHKGDNSTLVAATKYLTDTLKLFNTMMSGLDE